MKRKNRMSWLMGVIGAGLITLPVMGVAQCPNETTVWQNHHVFSPGVGLTASLPEPGILGIAAPLGGALTRTLDVPPGFQIRQVIACSIPAASNATLTQFEASIPLVPVAHGPELPTYCTTFVSANPSLPLINPQTAPTTLTLDFGPTPLVQVSGLGLVLRADASLWGFVPPHEHVYFTGRGRGHNNTATVTQGVVINGEECLASPSGSGGLLDDDGGKNKRGGKGKGKGKNK